MISYREKQLIAVQKMLQDNSKIMLERAMSLSSRNVVDCLNMDERFPDIRTYEELVTLAQSLDYDLYIRADDLLSPEELADIDRRREEIDAIFAKKTSIVNKTDLMFLAIATALQVTKALLFPYVAKKMNYGESFDKSKRYGHDDKIIKDTQRQKNNNFKNKNIEKHGSGYWINLIYQTPPYDITKGSASLGINMGGAYHRMYTLGHDPILGWIFGTMNILTDVITLNNFQSYRIIRKPTMSITPETVSIFELIKESYDMIEADSMNLKAAIFAQAVHFGSDWFTKVGLPIPVLGTFNEKLASKLYRNDYDAICFGRDMAIVGGSFAVSAIIDLIIKEIHGLFREENSDPKLYEVRTRKILLISNSIASTSSIINAAITSNVKNLDLGSLLNTIFHLFTDIRFITKIKQEFIENAINEQFEEELKKMELM